jgi:adenosylcobinamide-GDP ribazoletransferase
MTVLDEARAAAGLLTILPIGQRAVPDDARSGAALWLPLVGGLVGVVSAAAYALGEALLGGFYGAALALTTAAIVTGALHHDGLADTADGLGVRGDRARRLAVMRDPGIGAYGTLALVLYALLSTAAISALDAPDAAGAIVCGHVLGRWAALAQLALVAPARDDGLGAAFAATTPALAIGSAAAVAIAIAAAGVLAGLAAVAAAALAAASCAVAARRLVEGRTGDTLGAAVLVTEVVVLSVLAAYLSA